MDLLNFFKKIVLVESNKELFDTLISEQPGYVRQAYMENNEQQIANSFKWSNSIIYETNVSVIVS